MTDNETKWSPTGYIFSREGELYAEFAAAPGEVVHRRVEKARTTKLAGGDYAIPNSPFVVCKAPEKPKPGAKHKWLVFAADGPDPVGPVARFNSKAEALEFLALVAMFA